MGAGGAEPVRLWRIQIMSPRHYYMSEKIVSKVSELFSQKSTAISVGDQSIAVFHVEGAFYAIENLCPHRGAPLVDGELDGKLVICPWHRWEFDVTTGQSPANPAACVKTYPCKVVGEDVVVEVS